MSRQTTSKQTRRPLQILGLGEDRPDKVEGWQVTENNEMHCSLEKEGLSRLENIKMRVFSLTECYGKGSWILLFQN